MPPVPETASAPATRSESSRRSVEPKCSCPSNQSPVKPRPSAASRISPKGEANVVVTTGGSFQNFANIIPRTVQTTPADTFGQTRLSKGGHFPSQYRPDTESKRPKRCPAKTKVNGFPRSERVKTRAPKHPHFLLQNSRIHAIKPQEIVAKICRCFKGPK